MRFMVWLCGLAALMLCGGCSSTFPGWSSLGFRTSAELPPVFGVEWEDTDLDIYPYLKMGKAPPYPYGMKTVPGQATVSFTVNEKGEVVEIDATSMSHPYFGGNAAYMAKYWHFVPAEKDGKPVAVRGTIRWDYLPYSKWMVADNR